MAEEIIFKTSVETGNSVKEVNELAKSVNNVGDSVEDTQAEFERLRSEIKKQSSEVDSLSKKFGENSKQADEARKSLGELNIAYDELSKSSVDLGAKFEDVYGELQPLSSRLGEIEDRMYELALAGKQNTDEFKTLQQEVVNYRQTIISVDKSVDQLAEQGKLLGSALQIGSAVTAGYGALQGSMALLGGESEQLEQTFIKLQAVQTVLASLEQLKLSLDKQSLIVTKAKSAATAIMTFAQNGYTAATTATTVATKALGVAMMALPIVALIAGAIAISEALYDWVTATVDLEEENNKLEARLNSLGEARDRLAKKVLKDMDNEIATAKAKGATEEELHKLTLERMSKEESIRKIQIKAIEKENQDRRAHLKRALDAGQQDLADSIKEEIAKNRAKYKDLRELDGQYQIDRSNIEAEFKRKQQEQDEADRKERYDKWKAAEEKRKAEEERIAQERLDRQRLIEDLMAENIEDVNVRRLTQLQIQHQREREELVKKYGEDTELIKSLELNQANEVQSLLDEVEATRKAKEDELNAKKIEEQTKQRELEHRDRVAGLETELMQMGEDFYAKLELQKELDAVQLAYELENENLTEGEKDLIKEKYRQKDLERETELAEKKKQLNRDVSAASIAIAETSLNALQGLSDVLFEDQLDKAQKGSAAELAIKKKQFEINKKLQIAQAVMQGVQAVQAAYSSGSAIPIVGAVTGPLFAALAGVASVLNIRKIAKQKFENPSTSIGSQPTASMPSIPSAASVIGGENEGTATAGLAGSGTENQSSGQTINVKASIVDSELKAGLDNLNQSEVTSSMQ